VGSGAGCDDCPAVVEGDLCAFGAGGRGTAGGGFGGGGGGEPADGLVGLWHCLVAFLR